MRVENPFMWNISCQCLFKGVFVSFYSSLRGETNKQTKNKAVEPTPPNFDE